MGIKIFNLENDNRKILQKMGRFSVIEHLRDLSVAPSEAVSEYFLSKMNVHRRQLIIGLDGRTSAILQAGAMQWMTGNITATTGVKGVGDFLGKMAKSVVTDEATIKPEYMGQGLMILEPTYKFIILQNVAEWGNGGMAVEDGMFLACDGSVSQKIVSRSNVSSAVAGGEGLYNLCMYGSGTVASESNVPMEELIAVDLDNDTLKIDGNMAIAWSAGLQFTVERSGKTLVGSATSGEGLVNVYRGTGRVLMSPVASSTGSMTVTEQ